MLNVDLLLKQVKGVLQFIATASKNSETPVSCFWIRTDVKKLLDERSHQDPVQYLSPLYSLIFDIFIFTDSYSFSVNACLFEII